MRKDGFQYHGNVGSRNVRFAFHGRAARPLGGDQVTAATRRFGKPPGKEAIRGLLQLARATSRSPRGSDSIGNHIDLRSEVRNQERAML